MQDIATIAQGHFDEQKELDASTGKPAKADDRLYPLWLSGRPDSSGERGARFRIGRMRPVFEWNLGSRSLQLGKRTLVMGVINVTPDSFSDAGLYLDRDHAVEYGLQLLRDGAEVVDVGGGIDAARNQGFPFSGNHQFRPRRAPVSGQTTG